MSSLAEEASSLKPLTGKEKRTLTMLSFIRSRESTRKGELPPNLEGGRGGGREGGGYQNLDGYTLQGQLFV